MKTKPTTNLPASVRQRLLNRAKSENRPFNELMQYYAMERFLFRLSQSVHTHRFILKGALMLKVWCSPESRPTMDIDLLGVTSNDEARIAAQLREVLSIDVVPDGLAFDSSSIRAERITEAADYEGIRIRFRATLDSARIGMQVDIGFGDPVFPEPQERELPTLLEFPAPKLLCYSMESAIAEKFDAMVKHGELNSRMKDFYDVYQLSQQHDFEEARLRKAIQLTLARRGTELPTDIVAFTPDFAAAKQVQWTAFRKRLRYPHVPALFSDVVSAVSAFLTPVVTDMRSGTPLSRKWAASGPWVHAAQT